MQRRGLLMPIALGAGLAAAAVAAMAAAPTPFDGTYKGAMAVTPLGRENNYTNPPCEWRRPAQMSVHQGYVVMWYQDWHRHTIHYKGHVQADGAVRAYHRNRDGSASPLDGRISGNQFTADITRGRCEYSLQLTKE